MQPTEAEVYENGEVALEVHHFWHKDTSYWIRGGVGYLEFQEQDLRDLIALLKEYDSEVLKPKGSFNVGIRTIAAGILIVIVAGLVATCAGAVL